MLKQSAIFSPNEKFYHSHISSSVGVIKELLKGLVEIGITYFIFDRTYQDGSHIRLSSAGDWIEHYYRKKLYDVAIFEKNTKLFSAGFIFWSWLNRKPIYEDAALFDIDHGLTITEAHKSYCNFYQFGTKIDHYVSEENLLAKINYLHRFIAFFKQKANKLIQDAENNRFILPIQSNLYFHLSKSAFTLNSNQLKQSDLKRYYLGEEYNNSYLTAREVEIIINLQLGQRVSTIAEKLFISVKTIESHIKHIKEKLCCKTMFELGFTIHKLGIHYLKLKDK